MWISWSFCFFSGAELAIEEAAKSTEQFLDGKNHHEKENICETSPFPTKSPPCLVSKATPLESSANQRAPFQDITKDVLNRSVADPFEALNNMDQPERLEEIPTNVTAHERNREALQEAVAEEALCLVENVDLDAATEPEDEYFCAFMDGEVDVVVEKPTKTQLTEGANHGGGDTTLNGGQDALQEVQDLFLSAKSALESEQCFSEKDLPFRPNQSAPELPCLPLELPAEKEAETREAVIADEKVEKGDVSSGKKKRGRPKGSKKVEKPSSTPVKPSTTPVQDVERIRRCETPKEMSMSVVLALDDENPSRSPPNKMKPVAVPERELKVVAPVASPSPTSRGDEAFRGDLPVADLKVRSLATRSPVFGPSLDTTRTQPNSHEGDSTKVEASIDAPTQAKTTQTPKAAVRKGNKVPISASTAVKGRKRGRPAGQGKNISTNHVTTQNEHPTSEEYGEENDGAEGGAEKAQEEVLKPTLTSPVEKEYKRRRAGKSSGGEFSQEEKGIGVKSLDFEKEVIGVEADDTEEAELLFPYLDLTPKAVLENNELDEVGSGVMKKALKGKKRIIDSSPEASQQSPLQSEERKRGNPQELCNEFVDISPPEAQISAVQTSRKRPAEARSTEGSKKRKGSGAVEKKLKCKIPETEKATTSVPLKAKGKKVEIAQKGEESKQKDLETSLVPVQANKKSKQAPKGKDAAGKVSKLEIEETEVEAEGKKMTNDGGEGSSRGKGKKEERKRGRVEEKKTTADEEEEAEEAEGTGGQAAAVREWKKKPCFALGGWKEEQEEYRGMVRALGGRVCGEGHQWKSSATHVVLREMRRTEKFFCAAAAGRWILKPSYLEHSLSEGKFVPEAPHEWHGAGLTDDKSIQKNAPRFWRERKEKTGHGAFESLRVAFYGKSYIPPTETLKKAIKAGGGVIVAAEPPYKKGLSSGIDFAIVNADIPKEDSWVAQFISHGVPCVAPEYFVEFVAKPGQSLEPHVLHDCQELARNSLQNWEERRNGTLVAKDHHDVELDTDNGLDCKPVASRGTAGSKKGLKKSQKRGSQVELSKASDLWSRLPSPKGTVDEAESEVSADLGGGTVLDDDAQSENLEEVCVVCGKPDEPESLLLCGDGKKKGCDKGWHIHCLVPPLKRVPKADWFCSSCEGSGKNRSTRRKLSK